MCSEMCIRDRFNTMTHDQLEKKIEAFEAYKSESREYPHPRSPYGISTYAKYRGFQAGVELAEAFCIMREVV